MTTNEISQIDLFALPTFDALSALLSPDGYSPLIVIGCGRRKKRKTQQARDLYTSERFKISRTIAETLSSPYLILSGRHGLVLPETDLEPYNFDIGKQTEEVKYNWANTVLETLQNYTNSSQITLLATDFYSNTILECNARRSDPLPIVAPLAGVESQYHNYWFEQAYSMALRIRDLRKLYNLIEDARHDGKIFKLGDLKSYKLPMRGVYIFLDPAEKNFTGYSPRIVRIGTHGVSKGSKSSLRNRLRNHLGVMSGSGNHRGSIFRLHVGKAMLKFCGYKDQLNSWGVGQDAPSQVRADEDELERQVSEYLAQLEVFVIPIDDEPSKQSMRAYVETQLIALCSEGGVTIDKPSEEWLGLKSPMGSIVSSGLWNLRDVGRRYDPKGLGSVDYISSIGH